MVDKVNGTKASTHKKGRKKDYELNCIYYLCLLDWGEILKEEKRRLDAESSERRANLKET